MIFVDTSVWIDALRGETPAVVTRLRGLLDDGTVVLAAPVRVELLAGATRQTLPRMRRLLSALPLFFPTPSTWTLIDDWVTRAVSAGQRFGVGDLLIGAIAAEHQGTIWSLDRDFERLARLGLLRLHGA